MATRYNSEEGGGVTYFYELLINGTIFVLIKNNLSVMKFVYFLYEI